MNLRWLEALRAIIALGTVTQAAEHLGLTQPAVSRMLSNLEAEVGFRLFVRGHGRLTPTAEGERFYQEVERVIAGVNDIASIARDIRENRGARLRVVAMSAIANGLLPTALAQFLKTYPDLRLSLDIRGRRDVQHWIASQQFDIGIAVMPIEHTGLSSEAFLDADLFVVLPLGHMLAGKSNIQLSDLSGEPFVSLPSSALLRHEIDRVMEDHGSSYNTIIETTSLHSACQMVANGLGITIADVFSIACFVPGQFVFRPLVSPIQRTYGFLFPLNRPPSDVTQKFAETVRSAAASVLADVRTRAAARCAA